MEKTLSPEERIRRAEEIYYRKKMQNTSKRSARVNVSNKKDFGMLKKMFLQIIICIVIYVIYYMIQNTNYIFSENVLKKTDEILSYDINIKQLYEQGVGFLNSFANNVGGDAYIAPQNEMEQNGVAENQINENELSGNREIENTNSVEENIGGEDVDVTEINQKEPVKLTQMEQDAKDILASKSLVIPLKGTITSEYGPRNPETPTVPKNHTGIDIAVNEGTVFYASMDGVVEQVSSKGDLGNHIKIVNEDVMTVYAHCKTIYVKQGDMIKQGQELGEVGSTGNTTGPHLHFEIRKENRYVNPRYVLDF